MAFVDGTPGQRRVRHTPYSTSSDGAEIEYPATLGAVMLIWMVFARMAFLALLSLLVRVGVLLAGLYLSHPRRLQNRHTRLLSSTANAPLL